MIDNLEQLGLVLKNKRIEMEKDIKQMSLELKINVQILIDLEEGKRLKTDNAYARLVIKRYMKKINLDYLEYEKDIKELYPSVVEETIALNNENINVRINLKKKNNIKKFLTGSLATIFFIAVILLTIYNVKTNFIDNDVKEILNPTTYIDEKELEPNNVIEKPKPKTVVEFNDNIATIKVEDLKDLKITLKAKGLCYFDYSNKETFEIKKSKTLKKDDKEVITLDDASKYTFNIGAINELNVLVGDDDITDYFKDKSGRINIIFEKL